MNARYDPAHLARMLGRVSYFRSLQRADLQAIVISGQVRHYAEGEPLFHESTPCAGLFVLIRGGYSSTSSVLTDGNTLCRCTNR